MQTPKSGVRMARARRAIYEPLWQHRSSAQAARAQHSNQFTSSTQAVPKQHQSRAQAALKQHPPSSTQAAPE
eukprot:4971333-Lingulodinium_polyedra.AAC.1